MAIGMDRPAIGMVGVVIGTITIGSFSPAPSGFRFGVIRDVAGDTRDGDIHIIRTATTVAVITAPVTIPALIRAATTLEADTTVDQMSPSFSDA
jgi:hypothetical protein